MNYLRQAIACRGVRAPEVTRIVADWRHTRYLPEHDGYKARKRGPVGCGMSGGGRGSSRNNRVEGKGARVEAAGNGGAVGAPEQLRDRRFAQTRNLR